MVAPTPYLSRVYPTGSPVTRWQGPGVEPPNVVPAPGPFAMAKTAMPNLPSVMQLFTTPRKPGNGHPPV